MCKVGLHDVIIERPENLNEQTLESYLHARFFGKQVMIVVTELEFVKPPVP